MTNKQQTTTDEIITAPDEKLTLWTVLIYMAADNNLKEECIYALTEIFRVGPTPQIDVIAQLDSGDAITRYDFRELRRDGYSAGRVIGNLDDLKETVLSDQKALRSVSDSQMLNDFLSEMVGKPEAQSYNLVVLSGHGSGAVGDFLTADNPPSALSIPRLKLVVESLHEEIRRKIDVLGMDSCLMSMIEVMYELRDDINFLVGAEGFERNTGWPYHDILAALRGEPGMAPEKLARNIVKEHTNYYFPYHISGVSVDMAVCDLRDGDNVANLIGAINRLTQVLRENLNNPKIEHAILLAHWRAQSYKFELYVDLWDFCYLLREDLLRGSYGDDENESAWGGVKKAVEDACRDVIQAIENVVLISCYSGAASQHSHGLSIYFPWAKSDLDRDSEHYQKLAFAKATGWDEFLKAYAEKTRREVRDDGGKSKLGIKPLSMPLRDETEANVRIIPEIGKIIPEISKGGRIKTPRVKNPPTEFYPDDCV